MTLYIKYLLASTIVIERFISKRSGYLRQIAFISDSLPTPDGSIRILSGLKIFLMSFIELAKSSATEQHIQPAFISLTESPSLSRMVPSILTSPNSFSMMTVLEKSSDSLISFLIKLVLPDPRKPDTIFILVFFIFILHTH